LSALASLQSIWVYTHDSVGVGEDGPTHQPVEHLAALRAIPDLVVMRPGDANEVTEAWRAAVLRRDGPTALALSRQGMPTLDRTKYASAAGLHRGAYVLADLGEGDPELILMASGSELQYIAAAGEERLVSFPSWELFATQDRTYREAVLPAAITKRLAIEAGVAQGWERWVGDQGRVISVERFGASAPWKVIYEKLGLTADTVARQARALLAG
jgi:transketolase